MLWFIEISPKETFFREISLKLMPLIKVNDEKRV